jgi:hypothetical protein
LSENKTEDDQATTARTEGSEEATRATKEIAVRPKPNDDWPFDEPTRDGDGATTAKDDWPFTEPAGDGDGVVAPTDDWPFSEPTKPKKRKKRSKATKGHGDSAGDR